MPKENLEKLKKIEKINNLSEKEILKEIYKEELENNEILKKIKNYQKWSNIFRIMYWSLFIFIGFGIYYIFTPTFNYFSNLFFGTEKNISVENRNLQDLDLIKKVENLIQEKGKNN